MPIHQRRAGSTSRPRLPLHGEPQQTTDSSTATTCLWPGPPPTWEELLGQR